GRTRPLKAIVEDTPPTPRRGVWLEDRATRRAARREVRRCLVARTTMSASDIENRTDESKLRGVSELARGTPLRPDAVHQQTCTARREARGGSPAGLRGDVSRAGRWRMRAYGHW